MAQVRAQGSGSAGRDRLSAQRIADAALALVDESGVSAATMRAVAERLGVEAMSLYRHVQSRDEMLDAMVNQVVDELGDDPEVQRDPTDGWRPYMAGMARGVRRYARRHPHAFPLVATRPADAPWINPPLRSVRWVETFLAGLLADGFTDDQALFGYRVFNTFLLGYLLLETSAMTLNDPKPGDGSYDPRSASGDNDPVRPDSPVPGGLTPTRTATDREAVDEARNPRQLVNPQGSIDPERYPTVHRLAEGLSADLWDAEFDTALEHMLDRVAAFLRD